MNATSTSPKSKSNIKHRRKSSGQGPDQAAPGPFVIKLYPKLSAAGLKAKLDDKVELQCLPSDLPVDYFELQCLLSDLATRTNSITFDGLRPRWDGRGPAVQELVKRLAVTSGVDLGNREEVLSELQAALPAVLETLQRRSSVATQPSISTLEIVDEYLESKKPNLAPDSFITYRGILQSFARAFPDLPKQPEQIEKYMAWRRRPAKDGASALKAGTRRLMYSKLSDFYEFAHKRHGVPNVMELIDRPARGKGKESDYLTLNQLRDLLAAIPRRPRSDRLLAYVYLCVGQGLRPEEPPRLNAGDIFDDRLRIREGKERTEWMPLLPEVHQALLKICQGRAEQEPIFIRDTRKKARLGRKTLYNEVHNLFREAGIVGIMQAPKVLRHTFNTLAQGAGCGKDAARAMMRQRIQDVNDFYTHLSTEERLGLLRAKLEQYSPLRQVNGHLRSDLNKSTG